MYLRSDPNRAQRGRSSPRRRHERAYEALNALRHELQEEWEECVEELRFGRVGTTRDDDSVETSQDVLCRRAEQLTQEIRDLENAIGRFAAGAYGVCVDCGGRIPVARLSARPDAVRCVRCQESFEINGSQRSAERHAPEDFPGLTIQRAVVPLPRAPRSVRAGAIKEVSKMTGSKKTIRRTERRKKTGGERSAKPSKKQGASSRSKKR
jgi:RNA polymerase-binding transcription factor DksA